MTATGLTYPPTRHALDNLPTSTVVSAKVADFYQPILNDLKAAEAIFFQELRTGAPYVSDLLTHIAHYRGKQLRPMLLLLIAKATGGINENHHTLAAVVEMIHTATLVHDDILDQEELRRHVATVNSRWGNASSVLLGDLLFTHAFHLASQTGSALACQLIGEATNKVCEGELRQIGEQGNLQLTEEEYYSIIAGKTGALIEISCKLGAIYSNAAPKMIEAMTVYGKQIGVAFQIADDLLDILGSEKKTGKTLSTDVLQQKLTLPIIHLLSQKNSASEEALSILDGPTAAGLLRLKQLLRDAGSIGYAEKVAEKHLQAAKEALAELQESDAKRVLMAITEQVLRREA